MLPEGDILPDLPLRTLDLSAAHDLSFGSLLMFCPSGLCSRPFLQVFAHDLSFGSLLMFCPSGLCSWFVLRIVANVLSLESFWGRPGGALGVLTSPGGTQKLGQKRGTDMPIAIWEACKQ